MHYSIANRMVNHPPFGLGGSFGETALLPWSSSRHMVGIKEVAYRCLERCVHDVIPSAYGAFGPGRGLHYRLIEATESSRLTEFMVECHKLITANPKRHRRFEKGRELVRELMMELDTFEVCTGDGSVFGAFVHTIEPYRGSYVFNPPPPKETKTIKIFVSAFEGLVGEQLEKQMLETVVHEFVHFIESDCPPEERTLSNAESVLSQEGCGEVGALGGWGWR